METSAPNKYVVLRSLTTGEKFFTTNDESVDPTRLADGTVGYEVITYCDSVYWAQYTLFGAAFANRELRLEATRIIAQRRATEKVKVARK